VAKILVGLPTGTIARCQDYSFLPLNPRLGGLALSKSKLPPELTQKVARLVY
jgi:hypothetical protein